MAHESALLIKASWDPLRGLIRFGWVENHGLRPVG